MKKNEPSKPTAHQKTATKETKVVQKPKPQPKVPQKKTQVVQPPAPKKEQPKVEKPMESQDIQLTALAPILQSDDRRAIYLVDPVGNSYTFFKYKGRLIDVPSYHLQMHIKGVAREKIMDTIRKQFLYGIKRGEALVFHIGDGKLDMNEFFKGEPFWDPQQLFRSGGTYDEKWFQTQLSKPTDEDPYDNSTSTLPFPSNKVITIVSTSQDIPITAIPWLQPCLKHFRRLKIN